MKTIEILPQVQKMEFRNALAADLKKQPKYLRRFLSKIWHETDSKNGIGIFDRKKKDLTNRQIKPNLAGLVFAIDTQFLKISLYRRRNGKFFWGQV